MQTIGDRIKYLLDQMELSNYALAKLTGLSESGIGRIVKNQTSPNDTTLMTISDQLGTNLKWLKTGEGDMNEKNSPGLLFDEESEEYETVLDRVGKIMRFYKISLSEISNIIGFSSGDLYQMRKRDTKFNESQLRSILASLPEVNPEWLLTGKGDMLKSNEDLAVKAESNAVEIPVPQPGHEHEIELIKIEDSTEFRRVDEDLYMVICPLVNQYAYAGYAAGWSDPSYVDDLPKHAVMMRNLTLGVYRAFTVKGDSMDNGLKGAISDGDIVTGRKLYEKHWRNKLHLHQYKHFIIITDDGIQVKEIKEHRVSEGVIVCHSLNPDKKKYPDFELSLADVRELYYIKARTEPLE